MRIFSLDARNLLDEVLEAGARLRVNEGGELQIRGTANSETLSKIRLKRDALIELLEVGEGEWVPATRESGLSLDQNVRLAFWAPGGGERSSPVGWESGGAAEAADAVRMVQRCLFDPPANGAGLDKARPAAKEPRNR